MSLANLPVRDLQKEKDQARLILMNKIREQSRRCSGTTKKKKKKWRKKRDMPNAGREVKKYVAPQSRA